MTQVLSPGVPPAPETLVTRIKADFSWLTHHLILLGLTGALVIGSVYGVENLIAKHDLAAEQRADAKLAVLVATTNQHEAELAQTQAQLLTMVSQLQAQNAQLSQSIAARNVQTAKQVQKDATLDAAGAASRLSQQTAASGGEVTATGNSVTLDLPIARTVVSRLDQLATAQSDLADTQTELQNETTLFAKSQETNTQQTTVIADLKNQNVEQVKACAAEVKTVKAQDRKRLIKWLVITNTISFIAGKIVKVGI